jgi:uncharacterized phiE125 gp8 family phage protein
MGLLLLAAPSEAPVTVAEAQVQIRSENPEEVELLTSLISAATANAEAYCRRRFVTQAWRLLLDSFPGGCGDWSFSTQGTIPGSFVPWSGMPVWYDEYALRAARRRRAIVVPHPPLASVENVKYIDGNGVKQTLDPSAYVVRLAEVPGEIVPAFGQVWPSPRFQPDAVSVDFTAGYGDAAAVPDAVKRAILMIVDNLYENRGTQSPVQLHEIPQAATWLLGPYRVIRHAA